MPETDIKALPEAPQPKLIAAPPRRSRGPSRLTVILVIGAVLLALLLLFLIGYLPMRHRQSLTEARARQEAAALPVVNAMQVRKSPGMARIFLPGNVTPLNEAYIYARATGYVKRRYADIGDRVRAGQVLAEIEAPDLDAQVAQARADVAQAEQQLAQSRASLENAQAQEDLARITWQRYSVLVSHGAVSRQDADQQFATYRSDQANVRLQQAAIRTSEENIRSNQANLDRILSLQAYEYVRAPFAGVITARNFDVGAYISGSGSSLGLSTTPMGGTQTSGASGNAGSSGVATPAPAAGPSAGGEMYRIADIKVLRLLVNVPQSNAPSVRAGQVAEVFVQEFPGQTFAGRVARTSSSLDPSARTLLTEVDVPNPQSKLLPGMYTQVQFSQSRSDPPLLVPGDAVITQNNNLVLAVLTEAHPKQGQHVPPQARGIHLQPVTLGRDYGQVIEITSGLQGTEYIVTNPGDDVREGALVIPRAAPASEMPPVPAEAPSGIGSVSTEAPTQGGAPSGGKSGQQQNSGKTKGSSR